MSDIILPGFVDLHVHFREPGFSEKETIASGSTAAKKAGYAAVCTMPNLSPPPDCLANLEIQLEIISKNARIPTIPVGCISQNRLGTNVSNMEELAPYVCGFSDDGTGVQDGDFMRECFQRAKSLDKPILAHCEDISLLCGGYIHKGSYAKRHGHLGLSSESEWRPLARDLALVEETGCAYHMCHVSSLESVELIRAAKRKKLPISAETAPHYLLLTDENLEENGCFKMNPPLRSPADRDALLAGLRDGTIDCIATDHAPHTPAEKSRGLRDSAFGIVGLETAFPLLYSHLVRKNFLSLDTLLKCMSHNPRKLLEKWTGTSYRTEYIWNLQEKYLINPEHFYSKGRSTPFSGWEVYGICKGNSRSY